jgi:hypothetical protein
MIKINSMVKDLIPSNEIESDISKVRGEKIDEIF